jgi:hypothetical protein
MRMPLALSITLRFLEIQDGGLVLRRHCHTYYAKQLAQHAAMKCSALRIVMNQIEVR